MKKPLIIYIAGEKQHAGKTVISMGIISQLTKFMDPSDIGYIKPVGQELKMLPDGTRVDKDAFIIRKFCAFEDMNLKKVSPVRLASGVTKEYLSRLGPQEITDAYCEEIEQAIDSMSAKKVIIAEGTGHPGVGSIVKLSNATVSRMLDAHVIYLAGGGLGRSLDSMDVSLSYFLAGGCKVSGVIFNKVLPDKRQQMMDLIQEEFIQKHFIGFPDKLRIFGFLPEVVGLNRPSMSLVQKTCFPNAMVIGDTTSSRWETPCSKVRIISLPNIYFNPALHQDEDRELILIGAGSINRLRKILEYNTGLPLERQIAGIILTCAHEAKRSAEQLRMLREHDVPALYVKEDTTNTDARLYKCFNNTKLQLYDSWKHEQIINLFEQYFDTDKFMRTFNLK